MEAFRVRCAVLLLSMMATLSLLPAQSDSIEVKLVLFILWEFKEKSPRVFLPILSDFFSMS